MPSDPRSGPVPGRVRLYRSLFLLAALGSLALLVRARCQQLDSTRADALDQGLTALATALAEGGSLESARVAFTGAARVSVGDAWAVFCLSAVEELDGAWAPEAPPPDWTDAVRELRAGRLAAARARFDSLATRAHPLASRARYYVRLIADLEVAARRRGAESS